MCKQHTFTPAQLASLAHDSLEPPCAFVGEKKNPALLVRLALLSLEPPCTRLLEKKNPRFAKGCDTINIRGPEPEAKIESVRQLQLDLQYFVR